MGGYDNNPGRGNRETQKRVLERLIGLNDCLRVLAWAGNEKRNSKMPVTRIENQEGKVSVRSATMDTLNGESTKTGQIRGYVSL